MSASTLLVKLQVFAVFTLVSIRVLSESQVQQQSHTSRSYHCANPQTATCSWHRVQNHVFYKSRKQHNDMNRQALQDQLIQQMLDDMDLKTMTQLCYDYLDEGYAKYSDEELITECEEYYPELLEG